MSSDRQARIEPRLRVKFRNWLDELDDEQIEALADNWLNVMDDAALDRIDSWVIADKTIAELRAAREKPEPMSETEHAQRAAAQADDDEARADAEQFAREDAEGRQAMGDGW
jgi:hypothetical protein